MLTILANLNGVILLPLDSRAFWRSPCGLTFRGKPTLHRIEGKYLQNPCSPAQSPEILLGSDGPYIMAMGWRLPMDISPRFRAIMETPKKIIPVQRYFQNKGHPGCLNWNGWIWRGLCAKTKSRFSCCQDGSHCKWGLGYKPRMDEVETVLVEGPIVIIQLNSIRTWKRRLRGKLLILILSIWKPAWGPPVRQGQIWG